MVVKPVAFGIWLGLLPKETRSRGWDWEFESALLQRRAMQTAMILTTSNAAAQRSTDCLPHTACWLIAGAFNRSATDYPTRRSDLANPGRDHQKLRCREPRYSSWELLARHTDPTRHSNGSAPNEPDPLRHSIISAA
jgi:hypothetical protein